MDDLTLDNDVITIHKPFDKNYKFKIIADQDSAPMMENTVSVDEASMSETFWMTKVFGDYDIVKIGDGYLFTNGDHNLLLQRIEQ